jgi:hypothetical protein
LDIFTDKIYVDAGWQEALAERNVRIFTPVKLKKGQEFLDSADAYFFAAVSRVRQAIESFFNWINEKTHIQYGAFCRRPYFLYLCQA